MKFIGKKPPKVDEFDTIIWSQDLLRSILFCDFTFLRDQEKSKEIEQRISMLTICHLHRTTHHNLESFGYLEDQVLSTLMYLRLNEYDKAWYLIFNIFSYKVATNILNTKTLPENYLTSKTNIKDTKRYMVYAAKQSALSKIKLMIPQNTLDYFEVQSYAFLILAEKIHQVYFEYSNMDKTKAMNEFLGSICFYIDNPFLIDNTNDNTNDNTHDNVNDNCEFIFKYIIDRILTLLCALSFMSCQLHNLEIHKLSNLLVHLHNLLRCEEDENDYEETIKTLFREKINTNVERQLMLRCARIIYTLNFEKNEFNHLEKEIIKISREK